MSGQATTYPNGRFAQIVGWGSCVPEKILTNEALAKIVDTADDWIVSHTGIKQRHVVSGEKETTVTLALRAARDALLVAGLPPAQLDLIIVATATPEHVFPSTACLVQDAIGASHAGAYDLSAGCSGFIYALSMATGAVRSGLADNVLVIGAETLSRITDWTDRDTCVLFGDGAGAMVVSACHEHCGVLATELGSDGSGGDLLMLPAGGSRIPASHESISNGSHFIKMSGREVYRFATTQMPKAAENVSRKAGWQIADIDLIIPHQANMRIIESAAKRLNVPLDRVFINLEKYGNTSAASIPIALSEAVDAGRIKQGDKIVMVGFGAGLTWAAAAIEWGFPVPPAARSWWRRLLARIGMAFAGGRSAARRTERQVHNWALGPVEDDDWRKQLRERVDKFRERLGGDKEK